VLLSPALDSPTFKSQLFHSFFIPMRHFLKPILRLMLTVFNRRELKSVWTVLVGRMIVLCLPLCDDICGTFRVYPCTVSPVFIDYKVLVALMSRKDYQFVYLIEIYTVRELAVVVARRTMESNFLLKIVTNCRQLVYL